MPEGRVLLATFSEPLAHALRASIRRLVGNEPRLLERMEVQAMNGLGVRLYQAQIGPVKLASRADVDAHLREASKAVVSVNWWKSVVRVVSRPVDYAAACTTARSR